MPGTCLNPSLGRLGSPAHVCYLRHVRAPGTGVAPRKSCMKPASFYHYCPKCGVRQAAPPAAQVFNCSACGFRLFFNAASAVAVFITRPDGQLLLIERAKDPGRGKLAPPGGFIDIGETAEDAVQRETREEVGLELLDLRFVCSHPNAYLYADVTYPVLDIFFSARVSATVEARALDDVAAVRWMDPRQITPVDLAFPSMQYAFLKWREGRVVPVGG